MRTVLREITDKCHEDSKEGNVKSRDGELGNFQRKTPSLWLEDHVLGSSPTGKRQVGLK